MHVKYASPKALIIQKMSPTFVFKPSALKLSVRNSVTPFVVSANIGKRKGNPSLKIRFRYHFHSRVPRLPHGPREQISLSRSNRFLFFWFYAFSYADPLKLGAPNIHEHSGDQVRVTPTLRGPLPNSPWGAFSAARGDKEGARGGGRLITPRMASGLPPPVPRRRPPWVQGLCTSPPLRGRRSVPASPRKAGEARALLPPLPPRGGPGRGGPGAAPGSPGTDADSHRSAGSRPALPGSAASTPAPRRPAPREAGHRRSPGHHPPAARARGDTPPPLGRVGGRRARALFLTE